MTDELTSEIRSAYESGAEAWATGPEAVYRHLAQALVDASPVPLRGKRALDLGAGTGVASTVLTEAGSSVVAADLAVDMLRLDRALRPPAVVADITNLPFMDDSFTVAVCAFVINHLADPAAGLAECARVVGAGGIILASTFPLDGGHEVKAAVEDVLVRYGYTPPEWYREFRETMAVRTGTVDALTAAAEGAGLIDVNVARKGVSAGLDDPELATEWRLNMPHTIGFVTELPEARALQLRRDVAEGLPSRLSEEVDVLLLNARVS